jgi:hypothetical protein
MAGARATKKTRRALNGLDEETNTSGKPKGKIAKGKGRLKSSVGPPLPPPLHIEESAVSQLRPNTTFEGSLLNRKVTFMPLRCPEIASTPSLRKYYQCKFIYICLSMFNMTYLDIVVVIATDCAYIRGVVRHVHYAKSKSQEAPLFEIHWQSTRFNREKPKISIDLMLQGIRNYERICMNASRQVFCETTNFSVDEQMMSSNDVLEANECGGAMTSVFGFVDSDDTGEGSDDSSDDFPLVYSNVRDKEDVEEHPELITNVDWEIDGVMQEPNDKYRHDDRTKASDETYVREENKVLFTTPLQAFMTLVSFDWWLGVLDKTNARATAMVEAHPSQKLSGNAWKRTFSITELMQVIGLTILMTVSGNFEYRNYWTEEGCSEFILPDDIGTSFKDVIALYRFRQLRAAMTFHDIVNDVDPLYRIRPLINLLRATFSQYVVPGREVSIDEASVPCRSRFARHLIVYNASKPLGKHYVYVYIYMKYLLF